MRGTFLLEFALFPFERGMHRILFLFFLSLVLIDFFLFYLIDFVSIILKTFPTRHLFLVVDDAVRI